jgi:uncharacterized protein YeaO (DUF488 family)
MVIITKSIYESAKNDGYRVLITRYYPRGVSKDRFDEWIPALAPSSGLLFDYKKGRIDWPLFVDRLVDEFRGNLDSQEAIRVLNSKARSVNVTLLCYERSGQKCHRHIVREIIENPEILKFSVPVKERACA